MYLRFKGARNKVQDTRGKFELKTSRPAPCALIPDCLLLSQHDKRKSSSRETVTDKRDQAKRQ